MEQSINPHAYCRLRFDEAAEEAIENLANVLQWHRNSAHEGLFVAQKDARAGTSLARQSSSSSSVFERIRSIFFLFYARVCVSLSLSARVLMSAKENAAFRRSLFSLLSAGVRLRASKEREREREMENFLEASLSLWKKNLEISFSAHQIKTQRERERERPFR
jgi:hypothetical protein